MHEHGEAKDSCGSQKSNQTKITTIRIVIVSGFLVICFGHSSARRSSPKLCRGYAQASIQLSLKRIKMGQKYVKVDISANSTGSCYRPRPSKSAGEANLSLCNI